jgi:hypothetical protein
MRLLLLSDALSKAHVDVVKDNRAVVARVWRMVQTRCQRRTLSVPSS